MGFSVKGIILTVCVVAVTAYLAVAAIEDFRSKMVTRGKHLIGFVPSVGVWILFFEERTLYELGTIMLFSLLWILCGAIRVYGMADAFVLSNLTLFFGGIGGAAGIGMVILIMVIAGFTGVGEILIRSRVMSKNYEENRKIAFVPHILMGYVMAAVGIRIYFIV